MLPHTRPQLHLCGQVLILRSAGRATLARDAFRHEGRALARPDAKSPTRGDVAGFAFEVHFVRNGVLLLLHEWLPRIPRMADLFARNIVSALELVEDERVEFRKIDLAVVGQHSLLRSNIDDLAHDTVHRLGRHDLR